MVVNIMLQTMEYPNTCNHTPTYNSTYSNAKLINPQEGEIWYADLTDAKGSQQGGIRPVLIISNDKYNFFSTTVNARALVESDSFVGIPLTSRVDKYSPVHVNYSVNEIVGLIKDSAVEVEKMRDINKFQLKGKIGKMTNEQQELVAEKTLMQLPMMQRLLDKKVKMAVYSLSH
jgi:mRNA interferase MazF